MAIPPSPFAPFDKQAILLLLRAAGSHDPDVVERQRARFLAAARLGWIAGAVIMFLGVTVCFTPAGVAGGLPLIAGASWLMQRGRRNSAAVRQGFAEFNESAGG